MISIGEAQSIILSEARPLSTEDRPLADALGAVLAEEIIAPHDSPPFDNSAMDGFAIMAADTRGATPQSPVNLVIRDTIPAGHTTTRGLLAGEAAKIMTGAPMPPGADSVVEVEATSEDGSHVRVFREVLSGTNVRRAGEDVPRGAQVLAAGRILAPADVGVLASLGFSRVRVHRRPQVALLATGSELAELEEPLQPGKIRNSNSYALEAQCRELGLVPKKLGIAPDEYERTRDLIAEGLQADVLVTSGGVSVGEFDFVKDVQEALGVERRLWQVAMKPGKPLVFGVRDRTLVFGVPGNPVAAMISFELFVRPALLRLLGHQRVFRPLEKGVLEEDSPNHGDRLHVLRVAATRNEGRWCLRSAGSQGSAMLRSMVAADGLAFVPHEGGGKRQGDEVEFIMLRDKSLVALPQLVSRPV